MTDSQLARRVARSTGDSPRTVLRLGFQAGPPAPLEPEEIRLVVACPSCGRAVPYPGRAADGSPALAECADPGCDLYFGFDDADVHAV